MKKWEAHFVDYGFAIGILVIEVLFSQQFRKTLQKNFLPIFSCSDMKLEKSKQMITEKYSYVQHNLANV